MFFFQVWNGNWLSTTLYSLVSNKEINASKKKFDCSIKSFCIKFLATSHVNNVERIVY